MGNIYFLDDNNNIVPKEKATHAILKEEDKEIFISLQPQKAEQDQPITLSREAEKFIDSFAKEHKEAMEAKRK